MTAHVQAVVAEYRRRVPGVEPDVLDVDWMGIGHTTVVAVQLADDDLITVLGVFENQELQMVMAMVDCQWKEVPPPVH